MWPVTSAFQDAILLFPLTYVPVPGSNHRRHTVNPIGMPLYQLILLLHFSSTSHVAGHICLPRWNPLVSSHLPTSKRQQSTLSQCLTHRTDVPWCNSPVSSHLPTSTRQQSPCHNIEPIGLTFCDAIFLYPLTSLPVPGSNHPCHNFEPIGLTFHNATLLYSLTFLSVPGSKHHCQNIEPIWLILRQIRLPPYFFLFWLSDNNSIYSFNQWIAIQIALWNESYVSDTPQVTLAILLYMWSIVVLISVVGLLINCLRSMSDMKACNTSHSVLLSMMFRWKSPMIMNFSDWAEWFLSAEYNALIKFRTGVAGGCILQIT